MEMSIRKQPRFLRAALAAVVAIAALAPAAHAASGGIDPSGGTSPTTTSPDGTLEGVPPTYVKFSNLVVDKTGLSLRVLGAWSLAEGGPKDNPLNIGPGERYGTVRKGARATTRLLKGSELYRDIMRSAGGTDIEQIRAIGNSPWCTGCKGYNRLLRSAYRSVTVEP
jgi:hypothetical protein